MDASRGRRSCIQNALVGSSMACCSGLELCINIGSWLAGSVHEPSMAKLLRSSGRTRTT